MICWFSTSISYVLFFGLFRTWAGSLLGASKVCKSAGLKCQMNNNFYGCGYNHHVIKTTTTKNNKDSNFNFALWKKSIRKIACPTCKIWGKSSLVAQMVKNLLAVQKTQVWSLGWEIPWRKKWQPAPVFFPGKFHGQRSLMGYSPWGRKRLRHDLATKQVICIQQVNFESLGLKRIKCKKAIECSQVNMVH